MSLDALSVLERADLVRPLEVTGDSGTSGGFTFRHALVQDTAYASLLRLERKRLHRLIGETLEQLYPAAPAGTVALGSAGSDMPEPGMVEQLARHFHEAGDAARTLRYATLAGENAARVYANPEAIAFYVVALDAAAELDAPTATLSALYAKLGRTYELQLDTPRAVALYDQMSARAATRGDRALALDALLLRATLHATPTPVFDETRGRALLAEALDLASALHDDAAQAKIYWIYLLLEGFSVHPDAAIAAGEKGIALARALGLQEQLAYLLNDVASFGYHAALDGDRARAAALEARALWERLGNLPMLIDNLNNSAIFDHLHGDYSLATAELDRAYELATSIDNVWGMALASTVRGMLYFEDGDLARALERLQSACDLTLKSGVGMSLISGTVLALVYAELGALDEGYTVIQTAVSRADVPVYRVPSRAALAYLSLLRGDHVSTLTSGADFRFQEGGFMPLPGILLAGETALAAGDPVHLRAFMTATLADLERAQYRSFADDARLYLARAQAALGDVAGARATLDTAETSALALAGRRVLWKILATRAALETEAGEVARAGEFRDRARALLDDIVARTPSAYRSSFLAQAAARFPVLEPIPAPNPA